MHPKILQDYRTKLGGDPSDAEVTDAILVVVHDVCKMLANTHQFGYHNWDDIFQQAYKESLLVLDKDTYDIAKKPLSNFLYVHVHNRLSNLKRKQFFRAEAPCKCCDAFNPGPDPCRRWVEWNRRNESKQRLMRPMSLSGDTNLPAPNSDPSECVILGELTEYIEQRLSPDLVDDYNTFKAEGDLSKARRTRIRTALRLILEGSPYGGY